MSLKIDICSYDSKDQIGGPLIWIQRLPLRLRELGFDVRVKLFSWQEIDQGTVYCKLQEQGIPVQAIQFSDTETNVRWLLEMVAADPPDIFVANHVIPAYYAAKFIKEGGIPTIGVLRSDDSFYHAIADQFIYTNGPFKVSAVVCVSEYLSRVVTEKSHSLLPVRRIPSGTQIPMKKAKPPTDVLKLAYVGRMVEEQKQVSLLTIALVRATFEISGVEAKLYGDGSSRFVVDRIISDSGTSKVQCIGNLSPAKLQQALLDSHVIVLLSDYEGTPMAVMEAMACGCVPICLNIRSGIQELVKDGVTGLLVNNRGGGFVAAIRQLRDNPDLWKCMSGNARDHVKTYYSVNKCAKDWSNLFYSVFNEKTPAKPLSTQAHLQLPTTRPGFAHQDWRKPSRLKRHLGKWVGAYRKARMTFGRYRRRLFNQS